MITLNNAILQAFAKRGLSINEGIAIDARIVKSASRPMSNEDIRKRRRKRETLEGTVDKNGNPLKYSRDIESDWTIKNDTPHYGLKRTCLRRCTQWLYIGYHTDSCSASGP